MRDCIHLVLGAIYSVIMTVWVFIRFYAWTFCNAWKSSTIFDYEIMKRTRDNVAHDYERQIWVRTYYSNTHTHTKQARAKKHHAKRMILPPKRGRCPPQIQLFIIIILIITFAFSFTFPWAIIFATPKPTNAEKYK